MWMRPGGGPDGKNPPVPFYSKRDRMGTQFYLFPTVWVLFGGSFSLMWLRLPWMSITINKDR